MRMLGAQVSPAAARKGCELAPKEAPEGLELATFCGRDYLLFTFCVGNMVFFMRIPISCMEPGTTP